MSEFLTRNIVAIGWPGINDLTGKTREQIKDILSQPPYEYESLELGNAYATVDLFVNQMNIDDLVLVPNGDDIHFCIIKSSYYFDANYDSDTLGYSHQRKVEWLSSTSRINLPMDLRKSLRVHRTTADLTNHYETIKALAYGSALPQSQEANEDDSCVSVDYPLRPDVLVTVSIPRDITRMEAERLGNFIKTLYFQ
jgi:predicted Mrr-cat superfamily restriction endonuclease